ncbi:universal stress protein [Dechloromonas sp. HYN0024]|uniref:universal stress protein n=1 Tax=Dechloromonas sp. HYN0024 TaxID=2231055 RepID=UPI000E44D191|nr:universal stress protein [Dechloromonas sp. HYN0024]AXS79255.1 universal stress protein UspA [Dechloromonas sp. HYN0024]
MYRHMLVPLDGSELATSLISEAVEFARTLGAQITFFTMREDFGATESGALSRSLSPETYQELAAGDANAIVSKALAAAGAYKLQAEGVVRTGGKPYQLILSVAEEKGCDLIYMASHGRRGLRGLFLGSQTQKVLAHTKIPVLVATVESNAGADFARSAVGRIQDEHRTIAVILSGLRNSAEQLRDGATAIDMALLQDMVSYMTLFPERLHHPKEEQYLFAHLRKKTAELDEVINLLEAEHRDGASLLQEVSDLLRKLDTDPVLSRQAVAQSIERFVDSQWHHLNTEEKLILPSAKQHLAESEWQEIEMAFSVNGDLRRGSEDDLRFQELFVKLTNRSSLI